MSKTLRCVAKPCITNLANVYTRKLLWARCVRFVDPLQGASIGSASSVENTLDVETLQKRCASYSIPQGARKRYMIGGFGLE